MKKILASILIACTIAGAAAAQQLSPYAFPFIGKWNPTVAPMLLDDYGLQDIQNLRKDGKHFKGVSGHTAINTASPSTAGSAFTYILNGFHFRKDQPSESHVIVYAADSRAPTAGHLFQNTAVIPATGEFSQIALHSPSTFANYWRFAAAPAGNMIATNGDETLIWGGTEIEPISFVTSASSLTGTTGALTNPSDYSTEVRNTRRTADQVAVIGGGIDGYTKLMLHGDGADGSTTITDSEDTPKVITAAGSAAVDTAQYKYGTGALLLTGVSVDYASTPDHADWNMADGAFTIDFWVRFNALPSTGSSVILWSQTSTSNSAVFSMGYTAATGGSQYPTAQSSTYVLATSAISTTTNAPHFATDPTKGLDGAASTKSWLSASTTVTNQRFHIDLGSAKTVTRIYYENYHDSGAETDKGVQNFTIWGAGADDPGGTYEKVLLHFDGADTSTTFTDMGGKTWTSAADAQLKTAQKKFGVSSAYFDGTGDYISTPDHADFALGDTWTIDFWLYETSAVNKGYFGQYQDANNWFEIRTAATGAKTQVAGRVAGTVWNAEWASVPPNNAWTHVAIVCTANVLKLYFDGVTQGAPTLTGTVVDVANITGNFLVGMSQSSDVTYYHTGYMDEVRISKGIARWSTNFTPPTSAYGFPGFEDTTYATDTDWTQLSTSQNSFDQHSAADAADPKYITVTNTTAYRYYAIKFANNYGDASGMGLRRVTLQTTATAAVTDFTLELTTSSTPVKPIDAVEWTTTAQTGRWYHIAIVRGWGGVANSWAITVDGASLGATTLATTYPDVPAILKIGAGAASGLNGWIDEFRISKGVARWRSDFTPATRAYATDSNTFLIGFTRPLQGVKLYIGDANSETSTMAVSEWTGSSWTALTASDNTSYGGATLGQTGTVTWATTVATSKPRYINGLSLYWYQFTITSGNATIYYATVDAPMQSIKNVWDGVEGPVVKFLYYDAATYNDYTDDVGDGSDLSGATLGSMATTHAIYLGFLEPQQGFSFRIPAGDENTNASVMTVKYWNGAEWVTLSAMFDGTDIGGDTLAKGGVVSFQAAPAGSEFTKAISDEFPLYYYQITVSATLDAGVTVSEVQGIGAPPSMATYRFGATFQNRLFLFNEGSGAKNKAVYSSANAPDIFNGYDYGELTFGDQTEITAAAAIFNVFTDSAVEQLIVAKKNETWRLAGNTTDDWNIKRISSNIGCVAPLSMVSAEITETATDQSQRRTVAIWVSDRGPVMSTGATVIPIYDEIKCYWDPTDSRYIPTAMQPFSVGWYDTQTRSYKLLVASGSSATYLNTELEYSLIYKEWTKIYRENASGANPLQSGWPVWDVNGIGYTYGGGKDGKMYRLENGNNWDGVANITSYLHTKDLILDNELPLFRKSAVKYLRTIYNQKNMGNITISHYGDKTLTVSGTSGQFGPAAITSASTTWYNTQSTNLGEFLYHSFKFQATTNVANGLELYGFGVYFSPSNVMR